MSDLTHLLLPTRQMLDDTGYDPRDGSNLYTRVIDRAMGDMLDLGAWKVTDIAQRIPVSGLPVYDNFANQSSGDDECGCCFCSKL